MTLTEAGGSPASRTASYQPHSAQCELARLCAVWSVRGAHTRTSGIQRKWPAGPGCTPEERVGV